MMPTIRAIIICILYACYHAYNKNDVPVTYLEKNAQAHGFQLYQKCCPVHKLITMRTSNTLVIIKLTDLISKV